MSIKSKQLMFSSVELFCALNGILGPAMILDENNEEGRAFREKNMDLGNIPDEIRSWIEKRSPTFHEWGSRMRDMGHVSGDNSFSAEQQCQQLVEALEDIESVMREGESISQETNIAGQEKKLFDVLINGLSNLHKYYQQAEDYLAQ